MTHPKIIPAVKTLDSDRTRHAKHARNVADELSSLIERWDWATSNSDLPPSQQCLVDRRFRRQCQRLQRSRRRQK